MNAINELFNVWMLSGDAFAERFWVDFEPPRHRRRLEWKKKLNMKRIVKFPCDTGKLLCLLSHASLWMFSAFSLPKLEHLSSMNFDISRRKCAIFFRKIQWNVKLQKIEANDFDHYVNHHHIYNIESSLILSNGTLCRSTMSWCAVQRFFRRFKRIHLIRYLL